MALIKCPECKKKISNLVVLCPYCGYPLSKETAEHSEQDNNINKKEKNKTKKKMHLIIVTCSLLLVIISGIGIYAYYNINNNKYDEAMHFYNAKNYDGAEEKFSELGNFKDSENFVVSCQQAKNKIIAAEKKESENVYEKNLDNLAYNIAVEFYGLGILCGGISDSWGAAVENGYDINANIQMTLQVYQDGGTLDRIAASKSTEEAAMKELINPPDKYSDAYSLVLDLYGFYTQLYELTTNPSGSYVSYNEKINDLSSEFEKAYNQLCVIEPGVKVPYFG